MIKFFRKIRHKLLAENKLSQYVIYAIGEIILVVIGILIALQINNWHESVSRAAQEKQVLRELLINLRNDSLDNAVNVAWYQRVERSAAIINASLERKIPWNDSLAVHFGNLYTHGFATFNTSAFENLKSIGFDLISNDSIRIALTNLHAISYELIQKTEKEFAIDNHNQMVLPVLTSRLKMDRWFHAVPYDYDALMEDRVFQETVRFRGITMGYVGNNSKNANSRISHLIRMIEKELGIN
ncbi:DUF6090 family protein [Marinoscillum furvescens]|uniref:Uncharacterized protein n=1 Tax=Marinoscillum furvescens DSM 4134 TaxID=1122208 RepID=A0A3D9KXV7_MARFU|nr:DUF6090 family protein [Marinoscillum furvescens]RED92978.1 hypothetical protein C7460_1272 [Marinoscillum furvescens DSM 4134]